jgi:hypothetical protein
LEHYYRSLTALGVILIASGIVLVALPILARFVPSLDKLPWFILWVYRKNGFYFATSPLLIIVSLVSLLLNLLNRAR